jgi:hypothetical protein
VGNWAPFGKLRSRGTSFCSFVAFALYERKKDKDTIETYQTQESGTAAHQGSREEIEGGVEPLPALRAPVMTAAIIMKFARISSTQRATACTFLRLSNCSLCGTLYPEALHNRRIALVRNLRL